MLSKYTDALDERGIFWDGTPEEEQEYLAWYIPYTISQNLQQLWEDATAYQESFISGAAIGLLTIGVMQQKPKSLAIMNWIQDIWNNHYYVQKLLVDASYERYNFSACGECPYSVPELIEELGI